VYELKMMSIGGYSPQLNACVSCGSNEVYAFDLLKGGSVCRACGGKYIVKLDKNLYRALDYIIYSDDKKMLSFNASDGLMKLLCKIAEQYVELQLDQKFSSLDYYKTMLTM
jgi:DNA repair protein recO